MNIIELRNVRALLIPDLQNLLRRAVESGALISPLSFDDVAGDIVTFVTNENNFMLLGAEEGGFRAVILGQFPTSALFPHPVVILLYNEGSRALSRGMTDYLLDFIADHGYTQCLAVNSSKREDDVWLRALTPEGAQAYVHGSLCIFEVI